MNLVWILEGIHNLKNSTPVQNSMDAIYSLVKSEEDRPSTKRKRRDNDGYESVYSNDNNDSDVPSQKMSRF